jgi:hypothetical protein
LRPCWGGDIVASEAATWGRSAEKRVHLINSAAKEERVHPAFDCFEWGVLGSQRPHPGGDPAGPKGPWSHAVLSLRRTGEDIGEAWFRVEGGTLTVDVRVGADRGGDDDPWLIRLVADTLFGSDGLLSGYYDDRASRVRYRNLATGGWWEGSWAEMRGHAEPGAVLDSGRM